MRSIASEQGLPDLALTEVFATKGQVRVLRFLATEAEGSVTVVDVAETIGITRSGALKALTRLVRSGLVEMAEAGATARYVLRREGRLAQEIVRLFQLEHEALNPKENGGERARGNGNGNGNGNGRTNGNGNGVGETNLNGKTSGDTFQSGAGAFNPSSPEFHAALVSLLEEDLSLIRRARENVLKKLEDREPGNGHDLWEWRKVLDTYPLPRLLHFLESDSPRALRLRKSCPFPDVMSADERERLGGYLGRVH